MRVDVHVCACMCCTPAAELHPATACMDLHLLFQASNCVSVCVYNELDLNLDVPQCHRHNSWFEFSCWEDSCCAFWNQMWWVCDGLTGWEELCSSASNLWLSGFKPLSISWFIPCDWLWLWQKCTKWTQWFVQCGLKPVNGPTKFTPYQDFLPAKESPPAGP